MASVAFLVYAIPASISLKYTQWTGQCDDNVPPQQGNYKKIKTLNPDSLLVQLGPCVLTQAWPAPQQEKMQMGQKDRSKGIPYAQISDRSQWIFQRCTLALGLDP